MQVQVTKDKVTILDKCTVKVHKGEYNINKITFDLSEEYTDDLVVNAIFSLENGKAYQMSILNNECGIPAEVLASSGIVTLGVYAYKINNDELELRYSPYPTYFTVIGGSYDPTAEESQEITPSQYEQYMQALQDGLNEVSESIKKINQATDSANDLVDEINQKLENGDFNGVTPNLQIGTVTTLEPNEQATVTRTGTDEQPIFNFGIPQGIQGEQGIQGIPGQDGQPGQDGVDGKDATINGQNTVEITTDNNITLEQQDSVLKLGLNSQLIPKQDVEGTDNTFDDGLKSPLYALGGDGESKQITTTGANLLPYPYPSESKIQNGITFTVNIDGSVTLNGTSTGFTSFQIYGGVGLNQGLEIPGNYISGGNSKVQIGIYHNIDNTDYPELALNNSGFTEIDKNTYNTGYVEIRVNSGLTFNNETIFPMLSNEQNIPWEPYTNGIPSPSPDYPQEINSIEGSVEFDCSDNNGSSNEVTFNLGEEKLRSVGDVKDELVVDLETGDYYKVENVGEFVLNGSESWGLQSINEYGIANFYYTTGKEIYPINFDIISNYFASQNKIISQTKTNGIFMQWGNELYIRIEQEKVSTVEEFKQWLSTHNTIADYILQTPTTKKLGTLSAEDLAKLKTFKGYNNVTVNTNLGLMNIRFTYGLDIKKYVDNKLAEISAQLIKGE